MTVIDKREIPLTVTFGDLAIGEGFEDSEGNPNIKTGSEMCIYWDKRDQQWFPYMFMHARHVIIPLDITYTIERGERK